MERNMVFASFIIGKKGLFGNKKQL